MAPATSYIRIPSASHSCLALRSIIVQLGPINLARPSLLVNLYLEFFSHMCQSAASLISK